MMAKSNGLNHGSKSMFVLVILTALTFMTACAKTPPPELAELVERAAIEDLFNDYYSQFGPNGEHNFMSYFTADGRLEVNGLVATGYDEIKNMYAQAGASGEGTAPEAESAVPPGISEMMYTNFED